MTPTRPLPPALPGRPVRAASAGRLRGAWSPPSASAKRTSARCGRSAGHARSALCVGVESWRPAACCRPACTVAPVAARRRWRAPADPGSHLATYKQPCVCWDTGEGASGAQQVCCSGAGTGNAASPSAATARTGTASGGRPSARAPTRRRRLRRSGALRRPAAWRAVPRRASGPCPAPSRMPTSTHAATATTCSSRSVFCSASRFRGVGETTEGIRNVRNLHHWVHCPCILGRVRLAGSVQLGRPGRPRPARAHIRQPVAASLTSASCCVHEVPGVRSQLSDSLDAVSADVEHSQTCDTTSGTPRAARTVSDEAWV